MDPIRETLKEASDLMKEVIKSRKETDHQIPKGNGPSNERNRSPAQRIGPSIQRN